MVLSLKGVLFMATITVTDKPNILNPNNLSFEERAFTVTGTGKSRNRS